MTVSSKAVYINNNKSLSLSEEKWGGLYIGIPVSVIKLLKKNVNIN